MEWAIFSLRKRGEGKGDFSLCGKMLKEDMRLPAPAARLGPHLVGTSFPGRAWRQWSFLGQWEIGEKMIRKFARAGVKPAVSLCAGCKACAINCLALFVTQTYSLVPPSKTFPQPQGRASTTW
jgi:hypothetical protein